MNHMFLFRQPIFFFCCKKYVTHNKCTWTRINEKFMSDGGFLYVNMQVNGELWETPWPSSFLIGIVGGGVQLGPRGTVATIRPIVPAVGDYDDGEICGMIGRGNRSTRRKPAPVPLCPLQTPHAARTRTWATAVGSQRLTTWAMALSLVKR
jgi:hypothetical protein